MFSLSVLDRQLSSGEIDFDDYDFDALRVYVRTLYGNRPVAETLSVPAASVPVLAALGGALVAVPAAVGLAHLLGGGDPLGVVRPDDGMGTLFYVFLLIAASLLAALVLPALTWRRGEMMLMIDHITSAPAPLADDVLRRLASAGGRPRLPAGYSREYQFALAIRENPGLLLRRR